MWQNHKVECLRFGSMQNSISSDQERREKWVRLTLILHKSDSFKKYIYIYIVFEMFCVKTINWNKQMMKFSTVTFLKISYYCCCQWIFLPSWIFQWVVWVCVIYPEHQTLSFYQMPLAQGVVWCSGHIVIGHQRIMILF